LLRQANPETSPAPRNDVPHATRCSRNKPDPARPLCSLSYKKSHFYRIQGEIFLFVKIFAFVIFRPDGPKKAAFLTNCGTVLRYFFHFPTWVRKPFSYPRVTTGLPDCPDRKSPANRSQTGGIPGSRPRCVPPAGAFMRWEALKRDAKRPNGTRVHRPPECVGKGRMRKNLVFVSVQQMAAECIFVPGWLGDLCTSNDFQAVARTRAGTSTPAHFLPSKQFHFHVRSKEQEDH
jgi:hypothetical protein